MKRAYFTPTPNKNAVAHGGMGHIKVQCHCGKVMRECRCALKDKPIRYEMCPACIRNRGGV